eukprot:1158988-Pelagomonas_calceolata.AAC.12
MEVPRNACCPHRLPSTLPPPAACSLDSPFRLPVMPAEAALAIQQPLHSSAYKHDGRSTCLLLAQATSC